MDKGMQDAIDEVRAVREQDERRERMQEYVSLDDCKVGGRLVGILSDLPLWAQAYIKELREKLLEYNSLLPYDE